MLQGAAMTVQAVQTCKSEVACRIECLQKPYLQAPQHQATARHVPASGALVKQEIDTGLSMTSMTHPTASPAGT